MGKLDGEIALITGAARGIGAAVARTFVDEGARVVLGDVLHEECHRLATELDGRADFVALDVTSEIDWRRAVQWVQEEGLGPVSVLINNAGVLELGSMEAQSAACFRRVFNVNLYGPWLGMRAVAPGMRRRGGGVIVNISSVAGMTGYSDMSGYVASKWGLRGLTKTAALELGRDGIRVCSVHPGTVRTTMAEGVEDVDVAGGGVAAQPIQRLAEPAEVARMVAFVVAEATYSTGCEFVMDGGVTTGAVPVRAGRATCAAAMAGAGD